MKKFVVLLLLMVYGSATMGTTIHIHYCMNKLVGWSLVGKNDQKCHSCGMEKKGGCCKDSKAEIKLAADQQKAEVSSNANFPATNNSLLPIVTDYLQIAIADQDADQIANFSPPLISKSETPEFLCVFRI